MAVVHAVVQAPSRTDPAVRPLGCLTCRCRQPYEAVHFSVAILTARSRTTSFRDFKSWTVGWISTLGAMPTPSNFDPSGNICRTDATLSIMPFSNWVKFVDEYDPAVVSPSNRARPAILKGMTNASHAQT